MAYVYWSFDGALLPRYNAVSDLSTPTLAGSIVPSLGGLYDYVGSAVRPMTAVHQLEVTGIFAGAGFSNVFDPGIWATEEGRPIVTAASQGSQPILFIDQAAQSEGEFKALEAKLGVRGSLTVWDPVGNAFKSRQARLLRVRRIQEHRHGTLLIECSALFETLTAVWT